ncbi:hypothetical protein AAVH_09111 [Aphelenchoides avenae]|nr:hypothetical protein AAVH_09111 [Aphelenchus avenae]
MNATDVRTVKIVKKAPPLLGGPPYPGGPVIPPASNQGERTGSVGQPVLTRYILNLGPSVCPTLNDPADDVRCAVECASKPPNDYYCYCAGRCQWVMDEALTRTCICSNPSCDCRRQA